MHSFQDESLEGSVDLGTSPHAIIFRERYSSKNYAHIKLSSAKALAPKQESEVSNELKTGKEKKYISS